MGGQYFSMDKFYRSEERFDSDFLILDPWYTIKCLVKYIESCSINKGLSVSAKCIEPGQPGLGDRVGTFCNWLIFSMSKNRSIIQSAVGQNSYEQSP